MACLSLLSLQLSGAHVHFGEEGYVGAPENSYSHVHGAHGHHHDHGAAGDSGGHGHGAPDILGDHGQPAEPEAGNDYGQSRDVSLLDQTLTAFKIPLAVLAFLLLFLVLPRARALASPEVIYPVLSGRYTRWRPPLRAPPLIA